MAIDHHVFFCGFISVVLCSFDQTHAGAEIEKDCNMAVHELFQFGRRNIKSVLWPVVGVLELLTYRELFS
jgi:hypothetical protein